MLKSAINVVLGLFILSRYLVGGKVVNNAGEVDVAALCDRVIFQRRQKLGLRFILLTCNRARDNWQVF